MKKFKAWCKRTWQRFKKWSLGVLASLGFISVAMVQGIDLGYTRASEYSDGTPLPLSEIAESRLYCNGSLITTEPGADGSFNDVQTMLPVGTSTCYGTHVATNGLESDPSNTIDVVVMSSSAPNPPEMIP